MIDNNQLTEFAETSPDGWVQDAILKANAIINRHRKIACSISGGSDSDIMLDLL